HRVDDVPVEDESCLVPGVAHTIFPISALISARIPAAARDGLRSKRMARLTEMRHEAGSPFHAARTDAETSPPCAPTPGTRKGSFDALRTSATADGAVAPTTRPTLPWPLARSAMSATRRNSGEPSASRCCRSSAPGFELRQTTYTPRSSYRVNSSSESMPK